MLFRPAPATTGDHLKFIFRFRTAIEECENGDYDNLEAHLQLMRIVHDDFSQRLRKYADDN